MSVSLHCPQHPSIALANIVQTVSPRCGFLRTLVGQEPQPAVPSLRQLCLRTILDEQPQQLTRLSITHQEALFDEAEDARELLCCIDLFDQSVVHAHLCRRISYALNAKPSAQEECRLQAEKIAQSVEAHWEKAFIRVLFCELKSHGSLNELQAFSEACLPESVNAPIRRIHAQMEDKERALLKLKTWHKQVIVPALAASVIVDYSLLTRLIFYNIDANKAPSTVVAVHFCTLYALMAMIAFYKSLKKKYCCKTMSQHQLLSMEKENRLKEATTLIETMLLHKLANKPPSTPRAPREN